MSPINQDAARRLAEKALRDLEGECGTPLAFAGEPEAGEFGWLFSFNSAKFLATGEIHEAFVGSGPILISRRGNSYLLPSPALLDLSDPTVRENLPTTHP